LVPALLGVLGAMRALAVFTTAVVPRVRVQLLRWEGVADAIPDAALRSQALASLRFKRSNAEAAAVFSLLAPRRRRADIVALLVALQVLTDYLDSVSEVAVHDPLRNGLTLHQALVDAVRSASTPRDYYRHHPQCDDGGYVAQLVSFCQQKLNALPAAEVVRTTVVEAARRCGAGQSYTHDAIHLGPRRLEAWATTLTNGTGLSWWETAAGASSSVAVHALAAAAADPRTSRADAERTDTAYCFGIGSLTVLLDNLVDGEADAAGGGHNYLDYYACPASAASRLASIAQSANREARALLRRRQHEAIVAGVLGFYLSAPGARTGYAHPIKRELLAQASPAVWPILLAMRARRWIGG
jgi:tetraprenyl-beta-curcumene synthase